MKTVNSISGGQTSAYIAANYPSDYNVFALVTTDDKNCLYPDAKVRQLVSDKIGKEFIGTLEDDIIINTILDLEQFIGSKIHWVVGESFDNVINNNGLLPSPLRRYCTTEMKMKPIFEWWQKEIKEVAEFRIGFRANETNRMQNVISKLNENNLLEFKTIIGKSENGRNKWKNIEWQKPKFPLIEDNIYKDTVVEFWKDKPVQFAFMNNCVGCFHKQPPLLNYMYKNHKEKIEWFIKKESNRKHNWDKFRVDGLTYDKIANYNFTMNMFDDDFNECDSGFCGI
jgi:hypothetical protein